MTVTRPRFRAPMSLEPTVPHKRFSDAAMSNDSMIVKAESSRPHRTSVGNPVASKPRSRNIPTVAEEDLYRESAGLNLLLPKRQSSKLESVAETSSDPVGLWCE
jgi:hypothetical protein